MKILAADTSTMTGSLALVEFNGNDDGTVLFEESITSQVTHSRRLLAHIDYLLKEIGLSISDVDGFVVGTGPGSFTGIRIGVTTFKSLAWGLRKPVKGIPSLDALARQFSFFRGLICPVVDARKKEFYWALYEGSGQGTVSRTTEYSVTSADLLITAIDDFEGEIVLCGNGCSVIGEYLTAELGGRVYKAPPEFNIIRAVHLAAAALPDFINNSTDDPVTLTPCYVRPSEAELANPDIKIPQSK
ncbi:tRNA (adenosine(37)-N6)-threonylcarbamoyltransferase complex dimerization subunit type 1 TsaB [Thermodesulforhabdus norvegica]|uniref:tRNA threonylcarbamoyladenosine biosynthesis protein TsaB n=1 Tax=Thermodesulforhabdus norvegica TaxID=39841 RepID=A0A1I4QNL4_9BACT|nr:tRNA (adenosine(37)-N6)-threonylcarbamoyltransferase complex dimerization subunit type 1 TsaB [Thermodesulforhabdus norvegica]SFM41300.1 tRNA threonylcarbamoyladenosine biosynthesis protein TsaB [Thermodesulforhabdus norvegica]